GRLFSRFHRRDTSWGDLRLATCHLRQPASWEKNMAELLAEAIHALCLVVVDSNAISAIRSATQKILDQLGVPASFTPTAEQIALSMSATITTLVGYYIFFGKRHQRRRKRLQNELKSAQDRLLEAQNRVHMLEDKLIDEEIMGVGDTTNGRPTRIWMDGAFDMMHYGHMNAFRQGKALGTHLIVGVNSDESIAACKGAPVMRDDERLAAVEGCKWVDEVVPNVPYIMSAEYLDMIIKKYDIDYVVHGDDPCIVDGKDVYETAKDMGKYRTIPRTEGVSTTEIVGRLLIRSKVHHSKPPEVILCSLCWRCDCKLFQHQSRKHTNCQNDCNTSLYTEPADLLSVAGKNGRKKNGASKSTFFTTSRMLRLFSAGVHSPPKGAKVIYIAGAWDMFHAGHVAILKQAKAMGTYLIAGVYNDEIINSQQGLNMPILNLNERVLSVLGCGYVDDVLMDAPEVITQGMISSLNISLVVEVKVDDDADLSLVENLAESHETPRAMGILRQVESPSELTVARIIGRIQESRDAFEAKFAKKKIAE
ncbi:unnamed protein product, partial [Chrysoparadoxa australica]